MKNIEDVYLTHHFSVGKVRSGRSNFLSDPKEVRNDDRSKQRYGAPRIVSRTRYRFGLTILILLTVFGSFIYYAPDLIPGYNENRLMMNFIADFLFVASFFILGGEFWDKFRALFIYEAKAQIPDRKPG